jgi:hypothetical protein
MRPWLDFRTLRSTSLTHSFCAFLHYLKENPEVYLKRGFGQFFPSYIFLEDDSLLRYCAEQSRRNWPTFQTCLLPIDGGRKHPCKVGVFLKDYEVQYPRRHHLHARRREKLKFHFVFFISPFIWIQSFKLTWPWIINDLVNIIKIYSQLWYFAFIYFIFLDTTRVDTLFGT